MYICKTLAPGSGQFCCMKKISTPSDKSEKMCYNKMKAPKDENNEVQKGTQSMANQKRKTNSTISNSPLPLAIVIVFGLAAGVTLMVADHAPRTRSGIENSVPIVEEALSSETTTEVTTTTTASTSLTTTTTAVTTTQALPPGSVTGLTLSFYDAALKVGDKPVMPLVTMTPENATDKSEKWESTDQKVATVDWLGNITAVGSGSCIIRVTSVNNPAVFAEVKVSVVDPNETVTAKPKQTNDAASTTTTTQTASNTAERADMEVIDGITYIQKVMIVNKTYALPKTFNPGGLSEETRAAFTELQAAATKDGLSIYSVSDYRSYEMQDTLYHNYIARDGKEKADTFSARAGHSEHQTGLAIDCNYAGDAFHDTPEAKWLAENAWKYGFIIRFPKGKEEITGYKYESWHIRYLGKDMAKKVYDSGLCLEEYFNIDSKYAE